MVINRQRLIYAARAFLFVAIALTLLFIWKNSAMRPKESANLSNKVVELVQAVLPGVEDTDFVIKYIRKIAHFTEYGLFGIEVTLMLVTYGASLGWRMLLLPPIGFLTALCDEGIQIFFARGNSMKDVWLDFFGYIFYSLLTALVLLFVRHILKRTRGGKEDEK